MQLVRKPLQGVSNIIRFNWHFYLLAGLTLILLIFFTQFLPENIRAITFWLSILASFSIAVSLLISFYIYDISDLYKLYWLPDADHKTILNINAGFDETSETIKSKFPNSDLIICDFYNPENHTEISIKRARRKYPPVENTIQVSTEKLPFSDNTFDLSIAIFAVHEVRDEQERIRFFKEINRVTKSTGQIIVTEHLRDWINFIAYTIAFLHFYSYSSWLRTFEHANLTIKKEIKTTPFITTFVLEKDGDTF